MSILIVEDNATNAMILKRLAEKVGDEDVVVIADASEALQRCHNEVFSHLVVDHILPGMSGIQFIKAVRMMERYDGVPITMISADHEPGLRETALAAGATHFLPKPVDTMVFRTLLVSGVMPAGAAAL